MVNIQSFLNYINNPSDIATGFKKYEFALTIIMALGGLVVGGLGVAGYFHAGFLNDMSWLQSVTMMSVGGGCEALMLLLVIFRTCLLPLQTKPSHQQEHLHQNETQTTLKDPNTEIPPDVPGIIVNIGSHINDTGAAYTAEGEL